MIAPGSVRSTLIEAWHVSAHAARTDHDGKRVNGAAGDAASILASKLAKADQDVLDLIAAIKESREATQEFANDGQPANYVRWVDSEERLTAAIAAVEGVA